MGMNDDRGAPLGPYGLSEETIRMAQRIAEQTVHSTAEVLSEISTRLARGNNYPWLPDCLYFNLHSKEQVVMTYRIVTPEDDPDVVILSVRAMGPDFLRSWATR